MEDNSLNPEAHPAFSSDMQRSSGRSNGRSSSIDSTSDRPKSQAGEGTDSAKAGPSGFSKLLAARKKRKKKENQKATEELPTQFELEGEKDAQDRPDEPSEDRPPSAANNDGLNPQNDAANLLTDDSEPERTSPLTTQKSHAGFYTTSPPLIKTTSTDANDTDSGQADVESAVSGPSATAHSESNADTELSRPTSQPSSTLGVPEDRGGKKRSVSPGRRWKGAFGSGQDKKDSNRDRSSSTPSEGKKGGGLFGNSRRSSTSSKKAPTIVAESPPPLPPLIRTDVKEEKPVQPPDHAAPSTPPRRTIPAPHTTVTPPTPRTEAAANLFSSPDVTESPDSLKGKDPLPPGVVVSPSGNMISHRRVRSASSVSHKPSKLSNSISALGPTIEEAKATSKTNPGTQQSGFFSSVFSAAQNAASTLSSSLNTQSKTRGPSQQVSTESENTSTKDGESSQNETQESSKTEQKTPLAIETLGSGDLDFSHLDIAVPPGGSVSTPDGVVITKPDIPSDKRKNTAVHQRDEEAARLEDRHAARAVTMAYEKPSEVSVVPPSDESLELQSTSSLPRDTTGDHTSPSGSVLDGEISVRPSRSGSVRSRLTRRRHRGSSAATASTAAAPGASAMALGIPGGNSSVPRLTGFAVASKKRNRDFHQLFRSVPEDDYLIEDYSCALQREIILAGRIYVSEGHICFSSNILGWVTTLVISFDEIVAIEKESTAMVFPNAIAIQTLHARHTFRSLLSRESTYDLMVNIWKINHPALKSSVNGTRVEQGTGDKTEKAGEESEGGSEDEDEIYDEDEDGDNADSFFEPGDASVNGSDKSLPLRGLSRQASGNLPVNGTAPATSNTNGDPRGGKSANENADGDFPGPTTHGPTTYTDPAGQYDKVIKDEIIPAPLGKVYSYVFGPASTNFMPKTRQYSYIKPLNGSIGPKQTKCISTETLDFLDLEKAVLVTLSTQTPDVPSGNVFCTKTKYLFTWAANNQTRFLMTCTIEWSGKSWLKGPIEKGAIDGQGSFGSDLISALKAAVAPRARAASKAGGKGKGRRKKGDVANEEAAAAAAKAASDATKQQAQTWGPLEPIRGVLEPIAGVLKPMWNGNLAVLVIGILLFLRLAAYEEMWRREESELWSWLEDRVGMDGMVFPTVNRPGESRAHERARKIQSGRDFINKLDEDKMSVREMDHAIRTTREKLDTLEKILINRKMQATAGEDTMHSEL
ncbi:GRAM domain protein [Aspergillus arachidicola]|uniref:GRAM domain protein n=1 Tax=Aspergillus arachidicola TaxID=656916 RepID=A0A2G7ELB6_9EURO|nr:GRAM domain protein [Aspergillus arachidicola]